MHKPTGFNSLRHYLIWTGISLVVLLGLVFSLNPTYAQSSGQVEILTDYAEQGGGVFYALPNLKKGETLSVYVKGTSGNLDPFVALAEADLDRETLAEDFATEIDRAIAAGRDPLAVIPEFAGRFFVAWDDDSGQGYAAAFELIIPADGDYQLLVTSTPTQDTFGTYRLLIGLDTPVVLTGAAEPTGDTIAILDQATGERKAAVQEITDTLTTEKTSTFFNLSQFDAGDTLYVFTEATSGDLAPIIILEDFGNKPLASGNFTGQQTRATLEFTFDDDSLNNRLRISSCCDDAVTTGDYRLLVGVNDPEVLTGVATPTGEPTLLQPTEVKVGLKMQQITGVDQKSENFGVVASLRMEWQDPALAFSPDTCQCNFKTFSVGDFIKFATEQKIRWPEFTLFNQQGNRWSQNQLVVVFPEGRAIYFERFTTTLQAPDFDFRRFPFDTQQFFIHVDLLFPVEFYVFTDQQGFSEVGPKLGEEEWIVTDFDTTITSQTASTQAATSRFSFGFKAHRHLSFYIFRIFVPIAVIIVVSWFIFFLKDYGKRVEAASANLLLFIAFNFTISNDLPRLGYLTFLDTALVSTFIVTSLVVVFNVYLKRLEVDGKRERAQRIDRYTLWLYPIAYVVAFALVSYFFA